MAERQRRYYYGLIAVAGVLLILAMLNLDRLSAIREPPLDRTDYEAVATRFISKNGFIANKLGKLTRISHIGKGGAGGRESYNVFSLTGEERSGLINMTLSRTENNEWYVTLAELTTGGSTFEVPVSRSSGNKWQEFKWNED